MLRWQPQRLPEHTQFFSKIVGASVALHIAACLALFFYQANGGRISFNTKSMVRSDVIVKVLPFGQKKPATAVGMGKTGAAGGKISGKSKGLKTSVVTTKKAAKSAIAQKTVAKKTQKKTAVVHKKVTSKKQEKPAKKEIKKESVQNSAQQAVLAQPEPVKQEPVPVAPVVEQPVQPAVTEASSLRHPNSTESSTETTGYGGQGPATADAAASNQLTDGAGEQVMYVTQEELGDIELQRLLSDALVQAWHPPVGVPAHIECQALIEVDWRGGLASYKLTQTSGIMIYDVSVEEGIKALTFPRAVWGKTIELIFKPWAES